MKLRSVLLLICLVLGPTLAFGQNVRMTSPHSPVEVGDIFSSDIHFFVDPADHSHVRTFQIGIGYDATILRVNSTSNIYSEKGEPLTCDPNELQTIPTQEGELPTHGYPNAAICSQGFLGREVPDDGWIPVVRVTFEVMSKAKTSTQIQVLKTYARNNGGGSIQKTFITDFDLIRIINGDTVDAEAKVVKLFQETSSVSLEADTTSGDAPLTVSFTLTASNPNEDTLDCTFKAGEGFDSALIAISPPYPATENFSATYNEIGTYIATISCEDSEEVVEVASTTIAVGSGADGTGSRTSPVIDVTSSGCRIPHGAPFLLLLTLALLIPLRRIQPRNTK